MWPNFKKPVTSGNLEVTYDKVYCITFKCPYTYRVHYRFMIVT